MKKTTRNLIRMNGFFLMSLLVANVTAGKVVDAFGLVIPGAVVAYAITFLCTDVINEIWGREEANRSVRLGFVLQVVSTLLILLVIWMPPAPFAVEYSDAFTIVLKQNVRVVIASLTAYLISQSWDVFIFNRIRVKTEGRMKWLRNNLSTMSSQIIDTAIFITIAFYGLVPNIGWMIVSQYLVKLIIATLDTPVFYLLTRGSVEVIDNE